MILLLILQLRQMRLIKTLPIIILLLYSASSWECRQMNVAPIPEDVQPQHVSQCLREILEGGNLEQVGRLNTTLDERYEKQWITALEAEIRRLGLLQRELILGQSVLEPVIKWGQNMSHIFINIKTSHRWDSPPCLNTKRQTAFLNQTLLEYQNICLVSQQQLTFALRINLYKLANIAGSRGQNGNLLNFKVEKNGVGMYSAMFQKLQYEIWPYLNKEGSTYAIWIEMAERYPTDHSKYEELIKSIVTKQKKVRATKYENPICLCLLLLFLLLAI